MATDPEPTTAPPITEQSDVDLVATVGEVLATPRTEPADSFVLHAPLELAARAELLPRVPPAARDRARARIVEVAGQFTAFGPGVREPDPEDFPSLVTGAAALHDAIEAGDLDAVDRAARWVGRHANGEQLRTLLGPDVAPRLAAAAHAPIFLYHLPRVAPRGEISGELLRGLARELGRAPEWRIHWIEDRRPAAPTGADAMFDALAATPIGPPEPGDTPFIYPLMSRVDEDGTAAAQLADVVDGTDIADRARAIQRAAAWSMLRENDDHAPYGWSHCLTMPQAVLGLAGRGVAPDSALAVAATFVVGFRRTLARRPLVPEFAPDDPGLALADALAESATAAAAAAWHLPESRFPELMGEIATRASVQHDAHLVKYVLACLDAVAFDPTERRLYLTAAASLVGWWAATGRAG